MIDKAAPGSRPANRTQDRTLKGTTIGIAVASLGLSGLFTYQAASASAFKAEATAAPVAAPTQAPVSREQDDDDYRGPTGAAPPQSAPARRPVAVSGGS
jgi:hypothetical protein